MDHDALIDAQTHNTRSHAYSFVTSVVLSVCVCLLAIMATSRFALATTTGRPKGEDPNALKSFKHYLSSLLNTLVLPLQKSSASYWCAVCEWVL